MERVRADNNALDPTYIFSRYTSISNTGNENPTPFTELVLTPSATRGYKFYVTGRSTDNANATLVHNCSRLIIQEI